MNVALHSYLSWLASGLYSALLAPTTGASAASSFLSVVGFGVVIEVRPLVSSSALLFLLAGSWLPSREDFEGAKSLL